METSVTIGVLVLLLLFAAVLVFILCGGSLFRIAYALYTNKYVGRLIHEGGLWFQSATIPHCDGSVTELESMIVVTFAFLEDNLGYLIIDKASGESAFIDTADPTRAYAHYQLCQSIYLKIQREREKKKQRRRIGRMREGRSTSTGATPTLLQRDSAAAATTTTGLLSPLPLLGDEIAFPLGWSQSELHKLRAALSTIGADADGWEEEEDEGNDGDVENEHERNEAPRELLLKYILSTHSHQDHAGGNTKLLSSFMNLYSQSSSSSRHHPALPQVFVGAPKGSPVGSTTLILHLGGESTNGDVNGPISSSLSSTTTTINNNNNNNSNSKQSTLLRFIAVPCHTRDSAIIIAHPEKQEPREHLPTHVTQQHQRQHLRELHENSIAVFSGDTLFIGGVGKFFEGTAEMMKSILQSNEPSCEAGTVLSSSSSSSSYPVVSPFASYFLPDHALVFPGHDYARDNLRFCAWLVDSDIMGNKKEEEDSDANNTLQIDLQSVQTAKQQRRPALVPSTMKSERRRNPYLRACRNTATGAGSSIVTFRAAIEKKLPLLVQSANTNKSNNSNTTTTTAILTDVDMIAAIRKLKDKKLHLESTVKDMQRHAEDRNN